MKKDPIAVGTPLGRRLYEVSPDVIEKYMAGIGAQENRWYDRESPYGGPVAPAAILYYEPARFEAFMNYLAQRPGWNTRCDWEFLHPVLAGETLELSLSITDRWIKRGRENARFTMEARNAAKRVVCRGHYYEAYDDRPIDYDPPLPVRDSSRSELDRPAGQTVARFTQTFTLPMSIAVNRPEPNFHTHKELAQKRGYPDCVLAGAQFVCQLGELMTQTFGQAFMEGGTLKVNFLKPIIVNETITAVVAQGPAGSGDPDDETWMVWCEDSRGEKAIAGVATTPRRDARRPPRLAGVSLEFDHA